MVCSNCGYALGPDDQYCGGCGAFLSDAPEDEPGAALPDEPGQDDAWAVPYAPAQQPPPPRSGPPAGMIAAAVAGMVLIALLIFWIMRPDGDQATASDPATPAGTAAATPAPTDGAAPSPTETPTDTPTETSTETPTETPTPSPIELPGSAQGCNNVGSFVVYRGNTTTSCPFAENVGRAFADVEQPVTGEVALSDVSSPVTGLDYDLTCEFTNPVRCTGGNNAVVYLAPAT